MAKYKRYTLTLLGKAVPGVECHRFQRDEFRIPNPLSDADETLGLLRSPLCPADVALFEKEHDFNDISKAFVNQSIILNEQRLHVHGPMSVEKLQAAALVVYPAEKRSKAFDLYAQKISGKPYQMLVHDAKKTLIAQFKEAFKMTDFEHPMIRSRYDLGLHNRDVFNHPEITCSDQALQIYRKLAKQGHLYSQYMAGLLLATSKGSYNTACIPFLLDAYQNEHPEALDLLGRFLLLKEDYLGALQCGLLSCESKQHGSRRLLTQVLQRTSTQTVICGTLMPLTFFLVNHCLNADLKALVPKHTDIELYNPDKPRMPAFLARQLGIEP